MFELVLNEPVPPLELSRSNEASHLVCKSNKFNAFMIEVPII